MGIITVVLVCYRLEARDYVEEFFVDGGLALVVAMGFSRFLKPRWPHQPHLRHRERAIRQADGDRCGLGASDQSSTVSEES